MEDTTPTTPDTAGSITLSKRKGPTWKPAEDELLVLLWLDVAQDPAIDTEQMSAAFRERIHKVFHTTTTSSERPAAALHYRWEVIQRNFSKFCGAHAAIEKHN